MRSGRTAPWSGGPEERRRWGEWLRGLLARPSEAPAGARLELRHFTAEIEAGLRDIDFREVTIVDRIAFVETATAWQVRRALSFGRFDLAVQLQRFGVERIAELHERVHGWRPTVLYGVPVTSRQGGPPPAPCTE